MGSGRVLMEAPRCYGAGGVGAILHGSHYDYIYIGIIYRIYIYIYVSSVLRA